MKMKKNKIKGSFLIAGVLIVSMCLLVSAIGIGCQYSGSEMPLKISPGEKKTVLLTLQNPDITDEITLEGEILEGSEIASLKKTSFNVAHKATDVFAEMVVKIPKGANIGQTYNVVYKFQQVSGGQEGKGMISFGQSITRNFDINVVEPSEETPSSLSITWIIIGLIVIILVIIVVLLIKGKSQESSKSKKPVK